MGEESSKVITRSRPLSLQEKFPVRTRNASVICATVILARYDLSSAPSRAQLERRIQYLQDQCDLLRSRVLDSDKASPRWDLQDPWPTDRIIFETRLEPQSSSVEEVEHVLRAEYKHQADTRDTMIASESPLWRVALHSTPESVYIALNVQHEITDGRGLYALLQALLSDDPVEPEPMDKVIPMEETLMRPLGFALTARLLFREVLVPKLPWPLRGLFDPHPWPAETFRQKPLGLPGDVAIVQLDPLTVSALVALAKKHGVKLHALLKVGYMVSIWHTLDPAAKGPKPSLHRGHTPRSERENDPRHPKLTGNYASTIEGYLWLEPNTNFWNAVREINVLFHDPAKHDEAIRSMSLMKMIPEKASKKGLANPRVKTGWEETFIGIVDGPTPYRSSLSFSNLGSGTLPTGAKDMWWSQVPSAFQPVIVPCVMSHEAGLRMACVWSEGGCVVRDEVIKVNAAFEGLMQGLAKGGDKEDVVLGTLFETGTPST